jgi:hypothetical protein
MAKSRFMTIVVALICAVSVSVAAQSGTNDKKKDDGAVAGAKKLGSGLKDAVTPGDDKDKDKAKK